MARQSLNYAELHREGTELHRETSYISRMVTRLIARKRGIAPAESGTMWILWRISVLLTGKESLTGCARKAIAQP
jgi:hypothetical protein